MCSPPWELEGMCVVFLGPRRSLHGMRSGTSVAGVRWGVVIERLSVGFPVRREKGEAKYR